MGFFDIQIVMLFMFKVFWFIAIVWEDEFDSMSVRQHNRFESNQKLSKFLNICYITFEFSLSCSRHVPEVAFD